MTDYRYSQLRPLSHNVTSKPKEIAQDKDGASQNWGNRGNLLYEPGGGLISSNSIYIITNYSSRQAGKHTGCRNCKFPALYSVV
jgi:hypothetical protein